MPSTWECPSCKRRVPQDVDECRCGLTRAVADASLARLAVQNQGLPRDVMILIGVLVAVLVLGVLWLMRPSRPEPIVPVLGQVDRPAPKPPPKSPSPASPEPSPR